MSEVGFCNEHNEGLLPKAPTLKFQRKQLSQQRKNKIPGGSTRLFWKNLSGSYAELPRGCPRTRVLCSALGSPHEFLTDQLEAQTRALG